MATFSILTACRTTENSAPSPMAVDPPSAARCRIQIGPWANVHDADPGDTSLLPGEEGKDVRASFPSIFF
tara:strand:- start:1097 stop:1306 length:210 start_codon:yes stop_codon:yes gene_type:complete